MAARLVVPSILLADAFMRFVDEVRTAEADFPSVAQLRTADLSSYVERLEGMRTGSIETKAGVPLSTFWLLDDASEVVGVGTLRHRLTPALQEFGGHSGYAVRPSERGRGYGTAILSAMLERTRPLAIARVVLTCDAANVASWRVMERCGGRLDAEYDHAPSASRVRRYIIERASAT